MTPVAVVYSNAIAITPSDTANIVNAAQTTTIADAIFVGGAGTLAVVLQNGSAVSFTCVAGQVLPVRAVRVNNTGTAATLLVALFC